MGYSKKNPGIADSRDLVYARFTVLNLSMAAAQVKSVCAGSKVFSGSETGFAATRWQVQASLTVLLHGDQA